MNADFFINNRAALREKAECDLLVISANGLLQKSSENTFPFRQDSNFFYATGIDEPDIILVMDGKNEYLILPPREEIRNIFDGYIDKDKLTKTSGIKTILNKEAGWERLDNRIKQEKKIGILEPLAAFVEFYDFYSNPARRRLYEHVKAVKKSIKTVDIRPVFGELRVIKQSIEIKQIQAAIDITVDTIKEIVKKKSHYTYEYEVEADLSRGFRLKGAKGHSFDPVVAGGKNTSQVHYMHGNSRLPKNGILLLDVGAEVDYYAADISRVVPLGIITKRQTEVLAAIKRSLDHALTLMKPGQDYIEFEKLMEQYVGKEIKKLGLISRLSRKSIRKYFPHRTSHYVGLDVHDAGDYQQTMKENMVFAVEPGIIIAEEGIGMRIEETVLITKNGCKVLSSSLPAILE